MTDTSDQIWVEYEGHEWHVYTDEDHELAPNADRWHSHASVEAIVQEAANRERHMFDLGYEMGYADGVKGTRNEPDSN